MPCPAVKSKGWASFGSTITERRTKSSCPAVRSKDALRPSAWESGYPYLYGTVASSKSGDAGYPQWENYTSELWYGADGAPLETPYVDAIEMMDYILPEFAG